MAKNYIQRGDVLSLTAPYQRNSGEGALIGTLFGVALATVANAAVGDFATTGVFELTKNSAEAWTEGALVYWDNTNKRCTTTAAGNTRIGCAAAVAVNPSSVGKVRLSGVPAPSGVA